ncbi:MAG: 2-amino-4-hydroxy-6-hydroxymethyldihydropteridine diphosphokinase [Gammaproteobacteria bacterium]|nr:2-amino-4-hydroxy-6-hydroxymethyldihydropteridine diphosphokinase [Gammaproteobacteria bacterium]
MKAYIALGSNLARPLQQVQLACEELAAIPQTRLMRCSSLYRSAAIGPGVQPDYINAVAELQTELAPLTLLDQLQSIEASHDRQRSLRWGARTLDLDILLLNDQYIKLPRLCVPHPRMYERNFVLLPLAELEPMLTLPNGQSLQALLSRCPCNRLEKLAPPLEQAK